MKRPPQLNAENARSFDDDDVVACYHHRVPYHEEIIEILARLAGGDTGRALDIGTGLGELSRRLAPRIACVTAVDGSARMIEAARRLPGGESDRITWTVGWFEQIAPRLEGEFDVILGGDALHWLDWDQAFPHFRRLLAPGGVVACVSRRLFPDGWREQLMPVIREFSQSRRWVEYSLLELWTTHHGFEPLGEEKTGPYDHTMPLEDWIHSWHSSSSITRRRLGARSSDFDQRVREALAAKGERPGGPMVHTIWWGVPGHG